MEPAREIESFHPNAMEYETTEENYASINDVQLYYEYANCMPGELPPTDRYPILLVHGWTANQFILHPLFLHLKEIGWPVFRIDLRGHGWSQKGGLLDYTIPLMIDDIDKFIHEIIISEFGFIKVILCGHSMGGLVVQGLAVRHPPYLERLILLATQPNMFQGWFRRWAGCITLKFTAHHYDQVFAVKKKGHIPLGLEHFPQWTTRYNTKGRNLFPDPAATLGTLQSMLNFDLRSQIDGLSLPTLIIIGDHDQLIPLSHACWLNKHIPNSIFKIIPNCVHNLDIDRPLLIHQYIDQFLSIDQK